MRLTAPRDGVVFIATLEAGGAVSVLDPGHEVRAGERFVLDGAARLDDHEGKEWLVVTFSSDRPTEDTLRGWLPDVPAQRGPDRFVYELTRGP